MKYENLHLISKIFYLKRQGLNNREISNACKCTIYKVRHHFKANKELYNKIYESNSVLSEKDILKSLKSEFESYQTHCKPYKRPALEDLEKTIKESFNYSEILLKLNLDPENNNHRRKIYKLIKDNKLDVSHLEKKRNVRNQVKYFDPDDPYNTLFVTNSKATSATVKNYLFKLRIKEKCCEECGIESWNNKPITLELHHINGINNDNTLENLQIICPNCHSQTDNFKTKNAKLRLY